MNKIIFTVVLTLITATAYSQWNTLVHFEQGGSTLTVENGGAINFVSGGAITGASAIAATSLAATGAVSAGTTVTGGTAVIVTAGPIRSYSRTKAQILAIASPAIGDEYYCSDCTAVTKCVSTGTVVGSFVKIDARTAACD